MKGSVIAAVLIVVSLVAGFGGGYIAGALHLGKSAQVPTITSFKLSINTTEKGSLDPVLYYLNATEAGSPYEAGYQVVLTEGGEEVTLASGSFYGSLSYVSFSLVEELVLSSLPPQTYTLTASVFHESLSNVKSVSLRVIPPLNATISGPVNVDDSSGPASVVYSAQLTGGMSPYRYCWSIMNNTFTQQAKFTQVNDSSFPVTFYLNQGDAQLYGQYNGTMLIEFSASDFLGASVLMYLNVNLTGKQ